MKKKVLIALIAVFCSLAVLAGAITAAVFIVRGIKQREREARIDEYTAELSSCFPETDDLNLGIELEIYAYSNYNGWGATREDIYTQIEGEDAAIGMELLLATEEDMPVMRMAVWNDVQDLASVYLYNGKLYGCKFEDDPFSFYDGEMIAQILDVDEMFSDPEGDWQDLPSDADLEQLFGLLGMSDSEELSMLIDLMEDPEKLFIDAQKEEVDGTVRYCFDLDADYFESYFDEAEKSLVEQYAVSFKNRSACVYIAPKKDSLRLTFALRQSVNIDKRPYIVTTAFDIGIDLAAKAPYVINDVLAADRFGGGPTVRDVDCGYAEWQKASDLSLDGLAVLGYYKLDHFSESAPSALLVGEELVAFYDEKTLLVNSLDGHRVRELEYRYEIVSVSSDGNYLTVVLGEPLCDPKLGYLFEEGLIEGGNDLKFLTYDVTDFSLMSEVNLPLELQSECEISCLCGDTYVFCGDGYSYFIDVTDGSFVFSDNFYTLRDYMYFDREENKLWLYDLYLGGVVVDLNDCTYTIASALPEQENYKFKQVETEGYVYVNCFASWRGYDVALAMSEDRETEYLALYDQETESIVGRTEVKYFSRNSNLMTEDGKLVWWSSNYGVAGIADLTTLLGQG